jgi:5'-3' exonuclease
VNRVYLVDASIYIFGAYFSLPEAWHSDEGLPTQAVYGYTRFMLDLLENSKPRYVVAAFDESLGSCFRHEIYPEYKSNRELPDEALAFQIEACQLLTCLLGVRTEASEHFEADDIIATLARHASEAGRGTTIVSRDKDLAQLLVDPGNRLLDYRAGTELDAESFRQQKGIGAEQLVDYLALVGDRIDNVPGVPGVGDKTAVSLLQQFGCLDAILADPDQVAASGIRSAKRIAAKIREFQGQLELARNLVRLVSEVPVAGSLESMERQSTDLQPVLEFLDRLGLVAAFESRLNQSRLFA